MKAACYHGPMNITTEELEKPKIESYEILVKVKVCGICGSDLHMYKLGLFNEALCRQTKKGGIPGHEFSGEVVEVGSHVQGFAVGDRVAAIFHGGMAEYAPVPVLPGLTVIKLPPEVEFEEAATLEPLANSLHAAMKANPAKGENAVVFGAGIIGLGVIQCLKALEVNLNKLLSVDVSDRRLELAKQLGADEIINASVDDTVEKAKELTGSTPMLVAPTEFTANVDIVYDCVGYIKDRPEPQVIQQAINMVREFTGRIVIHGAFEDSVTLDLMPLVAKQANIFGSFGFSPEELAQALELIRTKRVDRQCLISHEFSLDKASEAFATQLRVEDSVKVIVKP
jgi:(R,R)-butanediol dehydrogenase/meso-butanediol dehydrogenase/diacetyl reductase